MIWTLVIIIGLGAPIVHPMPSQAACERAITAGKFMPGLHRRSAASVVVYCVQQEYRL